MKKVVLLLLMVFVGFTAFCGSVDLSVLIDSPSKSKGKSVVVSGMVYSVCPKNDRRIFISPVNDRTKRIPVMLQTTSDAYQGKVVEVTGVVKKTAYVAPKPCGRCDGADCGKNAAEQSKDASYFIEAKTVKVIK
ncbi:hypothetical protein [Alistipes sp. ZOR0009]|jgi:hypothetical protein|uniref:hypothetical protein n=1 Tax=Alistipes sp. ZOR0009 TaxID=1339253 RepID=UPI0006472FC9|nr:hypothetical protein [Alistipes sp. ZOR0009]